MFVNTCISFRKRLQKEGLWQNIEWFWLVTIGTLTLHSSVAPTSIKHVLKCSDNACTPVFYIGRIRLRIDCYTILVYSNICHKVYSINQSRVFYLLYIHTTSTLNCHSASPNCNGLLQPFCHKIPFCNKIFKPPKIRHCVIK